MPNAKLIQCSDEEYLSKKYLCNICTDEIPNGEIISLTCNPELHIFCYDCISDWYKEIKNKKFSGNYPIINICPVCRQSGGFLPCIKNDNYIKGIHIPTYTQQPPKVKVEVHICNAYIKKKDKYCTIRGKPEYGGFCGYHKNNKNNLSLEDSSNVEDSPVSISNPVMVDDNNQIIVNP